MNLPVPSVDSGATLEMCIQEIAMKYLTVTLLSLLAFPALSAGDIWTYRTAAQQDSAPKYFQREQGGEVVGLCVDIFRAIEEVDPAIRILGDQDMQPLARIERSVLFGKLDIFCGLGDNSQRREYYHFLQPPVFSVNYHLAVRIDDPVVIQTWDDVRKLGDKGIILVNHGSGAIARLHALGGLYVDDGGLTTSANLGKLISGRGRFLYYRIPGFQSEINRKGAEQQVRILPTVFETQPFYLLVRKNMDSERIKRLESALQQLADTGGMARIEQKYR